eukprot:gene7837-23229_t
MLREAGQGSLHPDTVKQLRDLYEKGILAKALLSQLWHKFTNHDVLAM